MEALNEKREDKWASKAKPQEEWIGGRFEASAAVIMIGDEYFGGFSGQVGASGKSLVKLRKGLTNAKLIWGLAKVRDYIRRLKDRGFEAKAYRVIVDREIQV